MARRTWWQREDGTEVCHLCDKPVDRSKDDLWYGISGAPVHAVCATNAYKKWGTPDDPAPRLPEKKLSGVVPSVRALTLGLVKLARESTAGSVEGRLRGYRVVVEAQPEELRVKLISPESLVLLDAPAQKVEEMWA